ncbi:MAG: PAS domain-containing protein [Verrucomicrobia bacterium]|nr:PAS domain-containing protein [Verrucomicrobiota bacterium]
MLITEHNAIQNSGNGIAVINQDGTIEFVNPMVEQMWACEPDALLGVDLRDLVSNRDVADELLRVLTEGGAQNWAGEATARRADGSEFDVQINGARNRNPDGETLGCVLSFMDIGDRKRAREAERQAEQHRVMLESLGAACHHVSQPATMLMGNLEMLMERLNEYDEASQLLIKRSLVAVEEVSRVLKRLTAVSEYKTMQYLGGEGGGSGTDSRILEI